MPQLPKTLAVLLSVVALSAAVQAQPCAGVGEETKGALAVLVSHYYPALKGPDCGMTVQYASETIVEQ